MDILFVCTGNTCRSPMAAALMRHLVAEAGLSWRVDSAGIYASAGHPMADDAIDALIRRHIVVSTHASKPVTHALVERADLILAMTSAHKAELCHQFPVAAEKTETLAAYAEDDTCDVPDPFGGDQKIYESCAATLERLIGRVFSKLQQDGAES